MPLDQMTEALREAVEVAGGMQAMGGALGISKQAVQQWIQPPAERVIQIERLTGVSRHRLRPDIYPLDDSAMDSKNTIPLSR